MRSITTERSQLDRALPANGERSRAIATVAFIAVGLATVAISAYLQYSSIGAMTGFEYAGGNGEWISLCTAVAGVGLLAAVVAWLIRATSVALYLGGIGILSAGAPLGMYCAKVRLGADAEAAMQYCESLVPALDVEFSRAGEFPSAIPTENGGHISTAHLIKVYVSRGYKFYDSFGTTYRFSVYGKEWWSDERVWGPAGFGL